MATPAVLAVASGPILSLADTAIIGRLGAEPLAARAIASSLFSGIHFSSLSLPFERRLLRLWSSLTLFMGWRLGTNLT